MICTSSSFDFTIFKKVCVLSDFRRARNFLCAFLRRSQISFRESELDLEERELALAQRVDELEARETELENEEPSRKLALEKRELALQQRELAIEQKMKSLSFREKELRSTENALAREEIELAERRWMLQARRDKPVGEMAKVFEALREGEKENREFLKLDSVPSRNVENTGDIAGIFLSDHDEAAWLKTRIEELKSRLSVVTSTVQKEDLSNADVLVLAAHAADLREHLRTMRIKVDLAGVMQMVNEVAAEVANMEAKSYSAYEAVLN